ncbi:MAG: ribonuclease III [Acidimicrobiales bacterium]
MPRPPVEDLAALAARLGYAFADVGLLEQAFRHRSWCAEHEGPSNERLEFLGDSVLGLAVTDYAYHACPTLSEGSLAKVRATVVSAVGLAELARELCLGPHLRLGRGEEASGGRAKASLLSDALEAVIGAVFVDGGWEAARALVVRLCAERISDAAEGPGVADYKTRLQELLARRDDGPLHYAMTEDGPDHDKWFTASVVIGPDVVGFGAGKSKKQAQQAAAQHAWERLVAETAEKAGLDARTT